LTIGLYCSLRIHYEEPPCNLLDAASSRSMTAAIPELAMETQVSIRGEAAPNDRIRLALKLANIPTGETVFAALE